MKNRDLNASPKKKLAEIVKGLQSTGVQGATGAHGVKHMGLTGDQRWYSPDGEEFSVRDISGDLGDAQIRLDDAEAAIRDTEAGLEQAQIERDEIDAGLVELGTVTLPNAVAALEQADADARTELTELDGKLTSTQQDLGEVRTDLTAARDTAEAAESAAAVAQSTADEAAASALAAAGIAADKGRIFYQADAPTGEGAESPNNLWIDSDDGAVYVWNGTEWEESQSEDLRDAAMAAVAAQQAADAADAKAQAAAEAAATAQAAAEAAQQTADDATLDARDAHNAAVAAQDQLDAKIASGDSLIINGSFESGALGWPSYIADNTHPRAGIVEDPDARTGTHTLRLTPVDSNTYPESTPLLAVTPGQVLNFRGWWKHLGGDGTQTRMLIRTHDADGAYVGIRYPSVRMDVQSWPIGEWILQEGDYVVEEGIRFLSFAGHATGASTSEYRVDDLQVIDVTDARAAQARADEAYQEAASKATPAEVTAAADAAEQAAIDAAEADATAKAATAKAEALSEAATTAQEKADAAQAAAEATAAQDAADKAEQALQDALDALATARGEITAEIKASANGKNSITISANEPSGDGVRSGDTWWRSDGAGNIFGQWVWNGAVWSARQIRSEVIANLDVHKLQVTGSAKIAEAVIEKVWADGIAARAVTAGSVTVAPGNMIAWTPRADGSSNIAPHNIYGSGAESIRWGTDTDMGGKVLIIQMAAGSTASRFVMQLHPTVDPTDLVTEFGGSPFPVRADTDYRIEFGLGAGGSYPDGRPALRASFYFYNHAGERIGIVGSGDLVDSTGSSVAQFSSPQRYGATVRTPVGAAFVNIFLSASNTGLLYLFEPELRPLVGAVQISDGAITTPKLTVTEDMSAEIVTAMSVNAAELVVTRGATIANAKLLGETWAESLTVTDKIIGTDGLFTGTVDFTNVNVTGTQIVNLLEANSISAEKIAGGSFLGETFTGGSFVGTYFDGGTVVGGIFKTSEGVSEHGGVAINQSMGIEGWDSSGYRTFQLDPNTGSLQLAAKSYFTDPSSGDGLIISPQTAFGNAALFFGRNKSVNADQAAIWRGSYTTARDQLMLRGGNGAGITVVGVNASSQIEGNLGVGGNVTLGGINNPTTVYGNLIGRGRVDVDGAFAIKGNGGIDGDLYYYGGGTNSRSANLTMQSGGGIISRSTSSRRYKRNIADWNPDAERVLALQPRQWQHDDPDSPIDETWRVGFVAEEVHDLGLKGLVEYAGDGRGGWRPEGLNYDRFAAAQQVVIRKHEAEIRELLARIERLEGVAR